MDIITDNIMEIDKKFSTDLVQKNPDFISFFEKDADFILAYKKTEKLASAIYIVTNHFSENEPIKWTIRKKATGLLSFMLDYKDITESIRVNFIYEVKAKVLELVSLLEVSSKAGLVSGMNFSVLKQEFLNLIDILNISKSATENPLQGVILKAFSDASGDESSNLKDYNKTYNARVGLSTRQDLSFRNQKDISCISEQNSLKRSNRQEIILGLLRKKKEITIKDAALVIKDCSDKTIQRELNSFISKGILKRVGVRRWSKYSLI